MAAKKKAAKKKTKSPEAIAVNRRARHEFEILEKIEAGLVLFGSEVKSLRENGATIGEAYARIQEGELFLVGAHIPKFKNASVFNHEPERPRKLLISKREFRRFHAGLAKKGLTVVPLRLYFNVRGLAKLQIGLGRGKKQHDKRQDLKKRAFEREMRRSFKRG